MGDYVFCPNCFEMTSRDGECCTNCGRDLAPSASHRPEDALQVGPTTAGLANCKTCGRPVAPTARTCPHCGESLPGSKEKCPKCGSMNLILGQKGFGLGKAAAGAVLIGPVGLLGGMIGRKKDELQCQSCGHRWSP